MFTLIKLITCTTAIRNGLLHGKLHTMYTKTMIIAAVASMSAAAQAYTANAFVSHSDCGGNPET